MQWCHIKINHFKYLSLFGTNLLYFLFCNLRIGGKFRIFYVLFPVRNPVVKEYSLWIWNSVNTLVDRVSWCDNVNKSKCLDWISINICFMLHFGAFHRSKPEKEINQSINKWKMLKCYCLFIYYKQDTYF